MLLLFVNLSRSLLLLITPAWLLLTVGSAERLRWLLLVALFFVVVIFLVILLLSLVVILCRIFWNCSLVLLRRPLMLLCLFLIVGILVLLRVLLRSCLIAPSLVYVRGTGSLISLCATSSTETLPLRFFVSIILFRVILCARL